MELRESLTVQSKSDLPKTLLLNDSLERTNETLQYYVLTNRSVGNFLRFVGVIWHDSKSSLGINLLQYVWNTIIRTGFLLFVAYALLIEVFIQEGDTLIFKLTSGIFAVTGLLQVITLMMALSDIRLRLASTIPHQYILFMNDALKLSYAVLFVSLFIGLSPILYLAVTTHSEDSKYFYFIALGEFSICCVLTATLYFICTECKIVSVLLDQLMEQQRHQQLTFAYYSTIRKEIRDRESSSAWINNAIIFVAFLDILSILLYVLIWTNRNVPRGSNVFTVSLFLKEIPFLMVVYWEVAQVNEKSAQFLSELSACEWRSESGLETDRKNIILNALCDPVSLSLAGMKLKRKDLMWQLLCWSFAFIASILRYVMLSSS